MVALVGLWFVIGFRLNLLKCKWISGIMGVHVADMHSLEEKLAVFRAGGLEQLHVVTDYDRTLTKAYHGGRIAGGFQILRHGGVMPKGFESESQYAFNEYFPLVCDHSIEYAIRQEKSREWLQVELSLLQKYGFSQQLLNTCLQGLDGIYRPKSLEMLSYFHDHEVPVLILSAGFGNLISASLAHENALYPTIHVVSNDVTFDEHGLMNGYEPNLVQMFDKNESCLSHLSYASDFSHRPNVLLLGDSMGDVEMADGLNHDVVLRVGFLNTDVDAKLNSYLRGFDIVITPEDDMDCVYQMIQDIF